MNYARFYALFNRILFKSDDLKKILVKQHTGGRTDSLREMKPAEYDKLCENLERSVRDPKSIEREELKRQRSRTLKLMQELGIDTTDWTRINAFCRDSRIVGQEFRDLSPDDLHALQAKLRSIQRNGGLKPHLCELGKPETQIIYIQNNGIIN